MKKRAFTLIEILITLLLIGIVSGLAFYGYRRFVERSKSAEALVNAAKIKEAEIARKADTGTYVPAANTAQVNEALALDIKPKYYEYSVVGVSDDSFVVLAKRIGDDVEEHLAKGELPADDSVIAMNETGRIAPGGGWSSSGAGSSGPSDLGRGGTLIPGGSPGSTSGGSSFGGAPSSGGGSGGGSSGGSRGGSSGGGSSGGSSSGGSSSGGSSSGGSSSGGGTTTPPTVATAYSVIDIQACLKDTTADYYYDLMADNSIGVAFDDLSDLGNGVLGVYFPTWWTDVGGDIGKRAINRIYINRDLDADQWSKEAVAAILVHELVHGDYDHNMDDRITDTLIDHPGETLTYAGDSSGNKYWVDSIEQEYHAFKQEAVFWKENKDEANSELDFIVSKYDYDVANGDDTLYDTVYSTYHPLGYPDYDKELS